LPDHRICAVHHNQNKISGESRMNKSFIFVAALVVGAISAACMAQEEEEEQEGPIGYAYVTYNYCKVSGQERADEIVEEFEAPVYDALVEEGVISGWGWLSHHTGGRWRRAFYYQHETVNGLLDAQAAMGERFDAMDLGDDADRSDLCGAHDDYIWSVEQTSDDPGAARGDAGLSVYYVCNESKEDRADELFESTFAPLLDKAVADGKITSWSWLSHFIGGKYRRLQSMTGADHKAVLAARGDLLEALYGGDEPNAAAVEFNEICGSHSDYMWDTEFSTP
jgi:hypothetical protein